MTDDLIEISTAPAISGLIFRHFRGQDDFAKMAAVVGASAEADKVERVSTAEDIAILYAHLANCDPYQDMIFAEINGETIGYSRCWWREEENGSFIYSFVNFLVPDWRNTGIPASMLYWIENRLRTIAQAHPAEREKFLEGATSQDERNATALLERENYQAIRYGWEMLRPNLDDIPDFALPEGLEIRPALPEQSRMIWDAAVEAFRGGWGFSEPTEEDYLASVENPASFQPDLWQVAWDVASNQIAGQVRPSIEAAHNEKFNLKQGKLDIVCVGPAWRKRGLARALIALSLHKLKEQGMNQAVLGVDSENVSGATRVYEDCGFRVAKRQTVYRKPL